MASSADGKFDPIHQFEVKRLFDFHIGGMDFSFTNSALFMVLSLVLISAFLIFSMKRSALIPGRWQSAAEMSYEFVANMVRDNVGKDGMHFFPFVFCLFMFILAANLLGLLPHAYTFTSQIVVTFALSLLVMAVVVLYGFYKNGLKFLKIFVPSGVPMVLLPLVSTIEVISFLSRPISLAIRLFANMFAGHITLKVFASFIIALAGAHTFGFVGSIMSFGMVVALTALEILVAFLQAYVFAVLTSIYLHDAMHPGH